MPTRASAGASWPEWVAPEVKDALANRGIRELWSHQAEAAELLHGGTHTVVATGTGSGKSVCENQRRPAFLGGSRSAGGPVQVRSVKNRSMR